MRGKVNESLSAADMSYEANLQVRHACEVIVNEVGIEKIKERVTNPLEGLKVAGYVGCQTVRPFANTESGGNYDTFDDPEFLDQFTEACGAEAVDYDVKTSCCGGSVSVISPEKTLHLIKEILQAAEDAGADVISTPCPAVSNQRGNVSAHDQQEIRNEFQHSSGVLQPAHGKSFRPGWEERCRLAPEHDPL